MCSGFCRVTTPTGRAQDHTDKTHVYDSFCFRLCFKIKRRHSGRRGVLARQTVGSAADDA